MSIVHSDLVSDSEPIAEIINSWFETSEEAVCVSVLVEVAVSIESLSKRRFCQH